MENLEKERIEYKDDNLFGPTVSEIFESYMELFTGLNREGTPKEESKIWNPTREQVTKIFDDSLEVLELEKQRTIAPFDKKKDLILRLKGIFELHHIPEGKPPVARPLRKSTRRTRRARGTRRNRRNRRS